MPQQRSRGHHDYTVAWICALPLERAAATAVLDKAHDGLEQPDCDNNSYTLGEISGHNIVIACLPSGVYGTTSATAVASALRSTFRNIKYALLVGIGGGVPGGNADIRLGDVVVSKPVGRSPGVIQYDHGQTISDYSLQITGSLNKPPPILLAAISRLESEAFMDKSNMKNIIIKALPRLKPEFEMPPPESDRLFAADYGHIEPESTCTKCSQDGEIKRAEPQSKNPVIHYGVIASGNRVMKHAPSRDRLAREHGILCFEMEAAGIMDHLPSLVVRGICDYADSHKNKEWQGYSALVAAAFTKELLMVVPKSSSYRKGEGTHPTVPDVPICQSPQSDQTSPSADHATYMTKLFLTDPLEGLAQLRRRKGERAEGTCQWILETTEIQTWLAPSGGDESHKSRILWLHGIPGTGKSTIAITLVDELLKTPVFQRGGHTLIYFFCQSSSEDTSTAIAVLRGLLYQLLTEHPSLMAHFQRRFDERGEPLLSSFESLWTMFTEMVSHVSAGEVYMILDALDECDGESQRTLLQQFTQLANVPLHVLVTSRPYREISEQLESAPNQDLRSFAKARDDIETFIQAKVKDLETKKRYPTKVTARVTDILKEKAEGTFLWVGIACDELSRLASKDAVSALETLPVGLHALYTKLLSDSMAYKHSSVDKIKLMLSLVAVAQRPLTLLELSLTCGLFEGHDEEERIQFTRDEVDLCRLLIIVQDERIFLLHKSVKDFLMSSEQQDLTQEQEAHTKFANRCISYLIEKLQPPSKGSTDDTFLSYSAEFWHAHIHSAASEFTIGPHEVEFFESESHTREAWLDFHRAHIQFSKSIPRGSSLLHLAGRWGLLSVVNYVFSSDPDCVPGIRTHGDESTAPKYTDTDWCNARGVTPLEECARAGHVDVFEALLQRSSHEMLLSHQVLLAVAGNDRTAVRMMEMVYHRHRDRVYITEDILKAVVENKEGFKLLSFLLEHDRDRIIVTSDVLTHAIDQNRFLNMSQELFDLIVQNLPPDSLFTETVMLDLITASDKIPFIISLFGEHRHKIRITELIIEKLFFYDYGAAIDALYEGKWELLDPDEIDCMFYFAVGGSKEVAHLLLDRLGERIVINSDHLWCASGNWDDGPEMVGLLLDMTGGELEITQEILENIVRNDRSGPQVLCALQQREKIPHGMTEALLLHSLDVDEPWKSSCPSYIIKNLPPTTVLSQTTILEVLEWCDLEAIENLLELRPECRNVAKTDMLMAVVESIHDEAIEMVVEWMGNEAPIDEDILVKAAAGVRLKDRMEYLLSCIPGKFKITDRIIEAAAKGSPDTLKFVLEARGGDFQITHSLLCCAASGFRTDGEITNLALLLSKNSQVPITEAILKATVAGNSAVKNIEMLLDRYPDLTITEEIMEQAVIHEDRIDILEVLISGLGNRVPITNRVKYSLDIAFEREDPWSKPQLLKTFQYLRSVCISRGDLRLALSFTGAEYNAGLKIWEPSHPSLLNSMHTIGWIQMKLSLPNARKTLLTALARKETSLGNDDPSTLETVCTLAEFYEDRQQSVLALEMYSRALSGYMRTLGVTHEKTRMMSIKCASFYPW